MTILTNHSILRAKERFSWNVEALQRTSDKAFEDGTAHAETKGKINKYIYHVYRKHKVANNIKIYGENIFLFSDNVLITLYRIPNRLIKHLYRI